MKRILYILVVFACTLTVEAQYKVVDKSSSKRPLWVNSIENSHLVVSASAKSIELAKAEILTLLKGQIIASIATHVVTATQVEKNSTTQDGVSENSSNYSLYVKERSANMPFIQEVTLAKAVDSYWEKQQDKRSKEVVYEYHILYPFSNFDLMKMVDQFDQYEKTVNDRLKTLADRLEQINTVEEIDQLIADIKVFQKELRSDDPRFDACVQLINQGFKLYSMIVITIDKEPKAQEMGFTLKLGNRTIRTIQRPQLASNCASKITCDAQGDSFRLRYDSFGCYEDDENYIDIRFRFSNQPISKRVFIPLK